MENFETPQKRVKEKNVYLLHLDAARIILIICAVLGIIVASFLIGMNYIGKDDGSALLTQNDKSLTTKDLGSLGNELPPLPSDDMSRPRDEKIPSIQKDEKNPEMHSKESSSRGQSKSEPVDILTNDNIRDSQQKTPETPVEKPDKKIEKTTGSKEGVIASRKIKKSEKKKSVKKHGESAKGKVVEVVDKNTPARVKDGRHYSIQVGSYDSSEKASSEIKTLRQMDYDVFMDKTSINGKKYYRVKIGPLASKKKAIDLLNDIQDNTKYKESYMVRE